MRMLMGGSVLALLAGCSLPASLVPGEPNVSKYSEKPPKEYAACVLPLWQHEVSKTSQTSISNGYRINAPGMISADEILDIVKSKDEKARKFMAELSGATVESFNAQIETTAFYYDPGAAAAFVRSPEMVTNMDLVRTFSFDNNAGHANGDGEADSFGFDY